jgi:hypothetical protein
MGLWLGYGKCLPRRRPAPDGRGVGAVVAGLHLPSPLQLLLAHRRRHLPLARLVHQDLLPPALLAAEPLVASARTADT